MSLIPSPSSSTVEGPASGQISEVVRLILDKGLVIDFFARVSLVGIEILTIDARVVVASVDTYLRFAQAAGRLDIEQATRKPGLTDVLQGVTNGVTGVAGAVTGGAGQRPAMLGQAPLHLPDMAADERTTEQDGESGASTRIHRRTTEKAR
jgi:hypothetical protein